MEFLRKIVLTLPKKDGLFTGAIEEDNFIFLKQKEQDPKATHLKYKELLYCHKDSKGWKETRPNIEFLIPKFWLRTFCPGPQVISEPHQDRIIGCFEYEAENFLEDNLKKRMNLKSKMSEITMKMFLENKRKRG